MGSLIAVVVAALGALVAFAIWRGRLVSIALAGAECPTCRIPLIAMATDGGARSWEVQACPRCEHLVTTVGHLPSPLAECPACKHQSLVVYAERSDGHVVVDEWCDLCGRRARTMIGDAPREPVPRQPSPRSERGPGSGDAGRVGESGAREGAGGQEGRVLPFRRR